VKSSDISLQFTSSHTRLQTYINRVVYMTHDVLHVVLLCNVREKSLQYSRHSFDKFGHSLAFFDKKHPDTSVY